MVNKNIDLNFIENFDYIFLLERFSTDFPEYSKRFPLIVSELKKFFSLSSTSDGPIAILSEEVDSLWHTFVLHTPQYEKFCTGAFGGYFHHQPNTKLTPVPPVAISNFFKEYQSKFDTIPQTWLNSIPSPYWNDLKIGLVPQEVLSQKWSGWPGWK